MRKHSSEPLKSTEQMSSVIRRSIRATPHRTGAEAWTTIAKLTAPDAKSSARVEMEKVAGAASMIVASEHPKDHPIVVYGSGPRVRIYCLYGEDAVLDDYANEKALPDTVVKGDWKMSLPCGEEDLDWVQKFLRERSSRITARALGDPVPGDEDEENRQAAQNRDINLDAFLNP